MEVGSSLLNINTLQELQRSSQTVSVPTPDVDLMVAGSIYALDVALDNDAGVVSGSVRFEGGTSTELLSIPGLAQPTTSPTAGTGFSVNFVGGANPIVGAPSVDLDDFELYVPFDETYLVTSALDEVDTSPGDGDCESDDGPCTLRAAIQESNANPGRSRITFSDTMPTVYTQSLLGANEDAGATGDYDILDDLEIRGHGIEQTRIDADGIDRAFHVPR